MEIGRCFEEGDPENYLCGDTQGGYFTTVVSVSLPGKLTSGEMCRTQGTVEEHVSGSSFHAGEPPGTCTRAGACPCSRKGERPLWLVQRACLRCSNALRCLG